MFTQKQDAGCIPVAEGILRKMRVNGTHTLMTNFVLKNDALLPVNKHLQEHTVYLVSCHISLTIGDSVNKVRDGDRGIISGDVEHHATIIADSVAVEVFSHVREDYHPYSRFSGRDCFCAIFEKIARMLAIGNLIRNMSTLLISPC